MLLAHEKRTRAYRYSGSIPAFPAQWLYGLLRALVSAKRARMCERAVLINRPSLDLSPFVLKGLEPVGKRGTDPVCLPQPEQLHGLRARTEQGREWMMAQNDRAVAGIDVAKDKVDACIRSLSQRQTFPSTAEGRRALIRWLRKHKIGKAAMEASGGYERGWAKALREAGIEVRIDDPKRVRSFARSAGRLAKNDPIDAEMIAWFAETFTDAPGQAYDAERENLVQIVTARQALLELQTSLQNRDEHSTPEVVQKMQARLLKKIAVEVAKLETAIAALIKATPHFAELAEIIESVPGLGEITSAGLIAAMPELGQVSNNIAAALLGVAPYDDDSGRRQGQRHIKGGRRKVRNIFYMACVGAATQHNPVLKAFYRRLITKGKEPKVAMTACMRKLIVILNTMIARRQKWDAASYKVSDPARPLPSACPA
ncbi:transposase [Bradyrhizobium sp. AZCC 1578]|uniref:IS110 family transposase n=1 Tax=Bradyrhizobium sp. AZCC 1578 TaxID=3117027 RepID=UPI002FF3996E